VVTGIHRAGNEQRAPLSTLPVYNLEHYPARFLMGPLRKENGVSPDRITLRIRDQKEKAWLPA